MKIHLIAVGGAAMHNLALALLENGHQVTGSDDEIYNPAKERLAKAGILPTEMGWFPSKITVDLDFIILGMHARKDNPELLKAQELGLKIYSYPEFIYQHSKDKKRIVVAGSHGKTTTTSMIMHVLKYHDFNFDYLVGALLEGFNLMVKLSSDAPIMIIEGDEYLSSPIDLVPKIHHYKPDIAIITGIAWDHMNVFPTYDNYVEQFRKFISTIKKTTGKLFYFNEDKDLNEIAQKALCKRLGYSAFNHLVKNNKTYILTGQNQEIPLAVFGEHNLANMKAAYWACHEVGITDEMFFEAIQSFKGAAKRLQTLCETESSIAYLDFAHAPSKVKATLNAVKAQFTNRQLVACLELHTYSSLNKAFLPQYESTMNGADIAAVFFNEHTLAMKKMPPLSIEEVKTFFGNPNLKVFTDNGEFTQFLKEQSFENQNLLLMTSGTFMGLDLKHLAESLLLRK